jgi:hypothetical protein
MTKKEELIQIMKQDIIYYAEEMIVLRSKDGNLIDFKFSGMQIKILENIIRGHMNNVDVMLKVEVE